MSLPCGDRTILQEKNINQNLELSQQNANLEPENLAFGF